MDQVVKAILVLMIAFLLQYAWQVYRAYHTAEQILEDVEVNDDLLTHTEEFKKPEIIEVSDRVYVALGFAIANSIMIDAPDGLIIVDSTEAMVTAKEILKAFREKVPHKPIKALVLTHNHADHTYGAEVFMEDVDSPPDVWSYHTLLSEVTRHALTGPTIYSRAMRQFGTFLPNIVNAGLGPKLEYDKESHTSGFVMPNKLVYEEEMDVTIAGLNMTLIHIPGETPDHLGIWIPQWKVFLCGDDIYKAFPNLYAIRGTPARDNLLWVQSLDRIMELEPDILLPSHTRPIIGKEKILETVTMYRDGIQFVHDQTIRYLNKGLHPNDIADLVHLPTHMAEFPYLKPFYGTVEWSVKGVFDRYLGWFSGDPVELSPLPPSEKAKKMIDLGGGVENVLIQAEEALIEKDCQWALQLSSYVFRLYPYNRRAKEIRQKTLKCLAALQTSANGRNYYLTYVLEDSNLLELKLNPRDMIFRLPLHQLFAAMATRLKVEMCGEMDQKGLFHFTDTEEIYLLHMRNGILETKQVTEDPQDWTYKVTLDSHLWREIIARLRSPLWAYVTGDMTVEGGVLNLKSFMDCFDRD